MVVVKKKPGEKNEHLIARFRKKVLNEGIVNEARHKSRFEPPSEKRKKKKSEIKHRIEIEKKRKRRFN